jgi:hypothetical protein
VYSFCSDETGVMVGVFSGSSETDEGWTRCIESVRAADDAALARGVPLVRILVSRAGRPRPPPVWRKRMAKGQSSVRSPLYSFAFVAPNALIRGVFTAISWMVKPPSPGHVTAAVATFADAATWVRKVTGRPYPKIEALYDAARGAPASTGRIAVATRSAS